MTKAEMKELFAQAWKEVFQVEEVTDDTDFFEAGGDSIMAVQLAAWLIQKGVKLDLVDLFTSATFGAIAEKLTEGEPMYVPEEMMTKEIAAKEMGFSSVEEAEAAEKAGFGAPAMNMQSPMGGQQACSPMGGQQVCSPMGNQQVCNPMGNQQVCNPAGNAADPMSMIPPQIRKYISRPVEQPIEKPNVIKINKMKLGEKVQSPEEALKTVLQGLLPNFDPAVDLFEQGLTSLDTVKMVTRCAEAGYELSMKDIYTNPRFEELVKCMK